MEDPRLLIRILIDRARKYMAGRMIDRTMEMIYALISSLTSHDFFGYICMYLTQFICGQVGWSVFELSSNTYGLR